MPNFLALITRRGTAESRAQWSLVGPRVSMHHASPTPIRSQGSYRKSQISKIGLFLCIVVMMACQALPVKAQSYQSTKESKVKVAYIYNFCRFIDWPESAFPESESPLVIGVLGQDPFGSSLDKLAERKKVKGRSVIVERFSSWKDYKLCHVLFIPGSVSDELLQEVLLATQEKPILIIGETHGFAEEGGSLDFYHNADGTIGFSINVDVMNRQQLRVNAKLLKLAKLVHDPNLQ